MPLNIVKGSITEIEADAIVNSTNEHLIPGGHGVDAAIHAAAGPELAEALAKIGSCPTGSAMITGSFGISTCRYIIHTAGPVFRGGYRGEREVLESCYESVLRLAAENGCRSLAIPVISAGAYGYPRREAYSICTRAVRNFLNREELEMMVSLVLYDEQIVAHSIAEGDMEAPVEAKAEKAPKLHEKRCTGEKKKDILMTPLSIRTDNLDLIKELLESSPRPAPGHSMPAPSAAVRPPKEETTEDYAVQDRSFGDMCEWWIEKKHMSKTTFYNRANLSKATFFHLKHTPDREPSKAKAFACVIGLRLGLAEAEDLLMRAGLAFSPFMPVDVIVKKHILKHSFDIDSINMELFEKDLYQLGTYTKEN